jgi:15-cis-phytoene synthase
MRLGEHAADAGVAEWRFPNRATPPGSSAYYSVRLTPAALRNDLAAVLAWRHQVRSVLDRVSDSGAAAAKLQWWRDELDRICVGEPRHPLSRALAPVMERHRLPTDAFLQVADQVGAELIGYRPANRAELEAACEVDLGAIFELLTRCHGITGPDDLTAARHLGGFCAQVYLIRDSGLHLRHGRAFLPTDRLAELGLSYQALAEAAQRARLPGLLAESARAALSYLDATLGGAEVLTGLPSSVRIRGRILRALLAELDAEEFDLADRRVGLTPLRKLWLAWREARRAV